MGEAEGEQCDTVSPWEADQAAGPRLPLLSPGSPRSGLGAAENLTSFLGLQGLPGHPDMGQWMALFWPSTFALPRGFGSVCAPLVSNLIYLTYRILFYLRVSVLLVFLTKLWTIHAEFSKMAYGLLADFVSAKKN